MFSQDLMNQNKQIKEFFQNKNKIPKVRTKEERPGPSLNTIPSVLIF